MKAIMVRVSDEVYERLSAYADMARDKVAVAARKFVEGGLEEAERPVVRDRHQKALRAAQDREAVRAPMPTSPERRIQSAPTQQEVLADLRAKMGAVNDGPLDTGILLADPVGVELTTECAACADPVDGCGEYPCECQCHGGVKSVRRKVR